ncbi:MAG TPA: hypothetical protein VI819_01085 [Patescibacteria group bacterium]|nr:hypothetical protein [Patescibacteria group bacterium]
MSESLNQFDTEVIAGPCSVDLELVRNLSGYYDLSEIKVRNIKGQIQTCLWGTRVVGLKSRTNLDGKSPMGADFNYYFECKENIIVLKNPLPTAPPPSVEAGIKIVKETGLLIATEIMMPSVQLPQYEGRIQPEKLLIWQPSVEGLGYAQLTMGEYARRNIWFQGVKNAKNLDISLDMSNDPVKYSGSALQRQWSGQASFAQNNERLIFIHRGIDSPDKGEWRSAPVHEIARHTKRSVIGARLFFDPSHSCGPNMRNKIVDESIKVMRMKDGNNWLYDGLLIEAGESITDSEQHITHDELRCLLQDLARFRNLRSPDFVEQKNLS